MEHGHPQPGRARVAGQELGPGAAGQSQGLAGDVGAVGVIVALAISSTIVDVSPFSTNGALVLANAQGVDKDRFYKQILKYSALVVVIGPLVAWAVLVLPGWL